MTEKVQDKPQFLRERSRLPQRAIDFIRARQQEQLMAVDRRLAATLDVTTTIARATGVPMETSGLDLLDTVERADLVLEGRRWQRLDGSIPHPAYCGLRSARYLFVHWADGFEELYDYGVDPFETRNRARWPAYTGIVATMRATTLARCSPVPPGFSWTRGAA